MAGLLRRAGSRSGRHAQRAQRPAERRSSPAAGEESPLRAGPAPDAADLQLAELVARFTPAAAAEPDAWALAVAGEDPDSPLPPPAGPVPPPVPAAAPAANGQPSIPPELAIEADTVVLPLVKRIRAAMNGSGTPDALVWPRHDEPTEIMPVLRPVEAEDGTLARLNAPSRRRTWLSRAVLLVILGAQAFVSLRLRNTAFEDEAQYLYAGRMELAHLLHGSALQGSYTSYFSGAPVLYPVLAAAASEAGGLAAARAVSLAEMLATTALLYMLTRHLFNERTGLCAAALFSGTMAVLFLGHFATFDASALFLLALAAWLAVRTAESRWPLFLLAAPVAALAVATKYAALLFVPTIVVLPALAGWPRRGRRVLLHPFALAAAIALLLAAALRLGGPQYLHAIGSTTTARAQGGTPVRTILAESLRWGGVLFGAAVAGTVAYAWRPRTERGEQIAPPGSRLRRAALGAVLTGTALLAPAYQAHIHTDVSFQKHIGFGLFFAAPMAGAGLARIIGDHFRRVQFGVAVWGLALALGITQAGQFFGTWPDSGQFTRVLARYLKPQALYLVEAPEVPMYYLGSHHDAQPRQFVSTAGLSVLTKQGKRLTGAAAFKLTIRQGWYQVVAYDDLTTTATDRLLRQDLTGSPYALRQVVSGSTHGSVYNYYVWVKLTPAQIRRARQQQRLRARQPAAPRPAAPIRQP